MCSGYDRYFQIARCFRDEDLRADRQPEFTQADMELSFVDVDDVIDVNERLLQYVFKEAAGVEISLPIQRMTWQEAMDRFGSDKPHPRLLYFYLLQTKADLPVLPAFFAPEPAAALLS